MHCRPVQCCASWWITSQRGLADPLALEEGEPGRQLIHCLVEAISDREVGEPGRQLIHCLVEAISNREVGEPGFGIIN